MEPAPHRLEQTEPLDRLDFQRGLRLQFPGSTHRVVYAASGQHLAACRIENPAAIIEHSLYWAATETREEAQYLTGILNSNALAQAVIPLQPRGQHNPRHFDTAIFKLGFPAYDPAQELHTRIVEHASAAEQVAAAITLDSAWQFQKARRVTRERLREHGVAGELDALVAELLAATAPLTPQPHSVWPPPAPLEVVGGATDGLEGNEPRVAAILGGSIDAPCPALRRRPLASTCSPPGTAADRRSRPSRRQTNTRVSPEQATRRSGAASGSRPPTCAGP